MAQGPNGRYVPSGVNAQSWIGFEERIQERRFRALLETMQQAIAAGNAVDARIALEEARELRPNAPELAAIEERVAAVPILLPSPAAAALIRSRVLGAVMLLVVGITLLMGIEWVRSPDAPAPAAVPIALAPELQVATPVTTVSDPVEVEVPVIIVPPPAAEDLAPAAPTGTSGEDRVIRPEPVRAIAQPVFRPAIVDDRRVADVVESRPVAAIEAAPIVGETPDDYVFTPPPPVVIRQPASGGVAGGTATPPAASLAAARPAAAPATMPATPVTPARGDQTGVAAVLNQYARAYGQLDAGAAREVWPTVNERALARAFAGLASQDVAFDDCEIDVRGTRANASCRGKASYVGKIGSGELRTESRTWRFELRRDGDAWKIENAEARRQ
jgi:hypothetical protein